MAQRQISSLREVKTVAGNVVTIGGEKYTDPDIYYVPQDDGTYEAVRLTVAPITSPLSLTVPYLNMNIEERRCSRGEIRYFAR